MRREEFAELACSYLEEITAYARRLLGNEWDADDLVQAAYERAFRHWREVREPAHCRAWLFRITRNLHLDRKRSEKSRDALRIVGGEVTDSQGSVSAETVERLTAKEIEAALGRLSNEQREAVLLCDLWGFRYEEIAKITGVPVGTVRSRISRGRQSLVRHLAAASGRRSRL